MEQLQIVGALVLMIALFVIIAMILKKKLDLKYALAWILVILLLLVIDLFPSVLSVLSYALGIATPVNTLFLLGLCFAVVLLFILTVMVSRMSARLRKLPQAMAILEQEMNDIKLNKE